MKNAIAVVLLVMVAGAVGANIPPLPPMTAPEEQSYSKEHKQEVLFRRIDGAGMAFAGVRMDFPEITYRKPGQRLIAMVKTVEQNSHFITVAPSVTLVQKAHEQSGLVTNDYSTIGACEPDTRSCTFVWSLAVHANEGETLPDEFGVTFWWKIEVR